MLKKKFIPVILGAIAITVVVLISVILTEEEGVDRNFLPETTPKPSEHISSGPLTILNYKHRLADNVFFMVTGLEPNQKGNFLVFTPEGILYTTIPFDGAKKSDFNYYFKPDTVRGLKVCTIEELVGVWTVIFSGIDYQPLQFEIINEFVLGGEADIVDVC